MKIRGNLKGLDYIMRKLFKEKKGNLKVIEKFVTREITRRGKIYMRVKQRKIKQIYTNTTLSNQTKKKKIIIYINVNLNSINKNIITNNNNNNSCPK